MIGRLSGHLLEKLPPHLLLDVQGVGYEVDVPMSTFYQLPATGEPLTLFIHQVVREDALLLYGFASRDERETFRQLLKVTGIGAKIALAILSGLSADELALAVASEDVGRLSKVPGIGKKTAERLLLELRGNPKLQREYVAAMPENARLVLCMWLLGTGLAAKLVRRAAMCAEGAA